VFPVLGARQIEEIKKSDIVKLLDRIEDENGPVMADRTLAYLRKVFNWHATRSDDFRSPFVRGMARTKPDERARKRILNDDEIRAVWKAAGEMKNAFGPLVRYLLLTGTRLREAAHMRRGELDNKAWVIPAARYKTKIDHAVPLSKAAKAIVEAMPVIDGSDLVFTNNGRTAISAWAQFKDRLDQLSGVHGWVLHDLRRTARSLMSRAKVSADIGERCLGHTMAGERKTYDRYDYLAEKAEAFEALAALVERIINPPANNVVELRGAQ
jgi:integrase